MHHRALFWTLASLLFWSETARAADERDPETVSVVLITIGALGIVSIFVFFIGAYARREWGNLFGTRASFGGVGESGGALPTEVTNKIERVAAGHSNPQLALKTISRLIEDETEKRVQEVQEELNVKHQIVLAEKTREVESVKKEVHAVREKYVQVEQLYKKTEDQKKTTEAVVRSMSDGLVVVNASGEVLMMNPSAEKLLGVATEQKIGKSILDESREELMISLTRQKEGSAEKVIEVKGQNENVKKVIRSSSAVIQNENGQTIGMVNILSDVTKQRELEEMKDRFLSNITHEFRTPIVAMQKAITILQGQAAGSMNETQTNFMSIVSRNATQLSQLVEDMLDVARLEQGRMKMNKVSSRLEKVIQDACATLETWAKSKNLKLVQQLETSLPNVVMDPARITQVLNNLLSNAIKFTPNGGTITVRCSLRADGDAQVSVEDTGCGIAKENLPKLFQRFEQFGDQQGIVGTGLGLTIVKEIVERHSGRIWAESQEGKGTKFTFSLPFKPPATEEGELRHDRKSA